MNASTKSKPTFFNLKSTQWVNAAGIAIALGLLAAMATYAYTVVQSRQSVGTATLKIDNRTIATLEVQASRAGKARGLSGRKTLPPGRGMLFPVAPPKPVKLWMWGVSFPLDILFIREGKIVRVVEGAAPCTKSNPHCPVYDSSEPVDMVVEIPAKSGVRPGTEVNIQIRTNR